MAIERPSDVRERLLVPVGKERPLCHKVLLSGPGKGGASRDLLELIERADDLGEALFQALVNVHERIFDMARVVRKNLATVLL